LFPFLRGIDASGIVKHGILAIVLSNLIMTTTVLKYSVFPKFLVSSSHNDFLDLNEKTLMDNYYILAVVCQND
jgi:hypothetical protein